MGLIQGDLQRLTWRNEKYGIGLGIEPSVKMGEAAQKRGITVIEAVASRGSSL